MKATKYGSVLTQVRVFPRACAGYGLFGSARHTYLSLGRRDWLDELRYSVAGTVASPDSLIARTTVAIELSVGFLNLHMSACEAFIANFLSRALPNVADCSLTIICARHSDR